MKTSLAVSAIALLAQAAFLHAHADTLGSGSATINFNQSGWNGLASGFGVGQPVLTLANFFDQAQASGTTEEALAEEAAATNPPYTGETYAMDGASVTNGPGQNAQPTTFSFTSGNPQGGTGSIGLGGIAVFNVSQAVGGGYLLFGDYTLQYNAARLGVPYDGSGWYLEDNIAPAAPAFDLLGADVTEAGDTLSISGTLGVTYEVANFLYSTPSDQGTNVGTFSFTGQVVPEPSAYLLILAATIAIGGFGRRKIFAAR